MTSTLQRVTYLPVRGGSVLVALFYAYRRNIDLDCYRDNYPVDIACYHHNVSSTKKMRSKTFKHQTHNETVLLARNVCRTMNKDGIDPPPHLIRISHLSLVKPDRPWTKEDVEKTRDYWEWTHEVSWLTTPSSRHVIGQTINSNQIGLRDTERMIRKNRERCRQRAIDAGWEPLTIRNFWKVWKWFDVDKTTKTRVIHTEPILL